MGRQGCTRQLFKLDRAKAVTRGRLVLVLSKDQGKIARAVLAYLGQYGYP